MRRTVADISITNGLELLLVKSNLAQIQIFKPATKLVIPAKAERRAGSQKWFCITGFPPSQE
jgi:hypothetical protein